MSRVFYNSLISKWNKVKLFYLMSWVCSSGQTGMFVFCLPEALTFGAESWSVCCRYKQKHCSFVVPHHSDTAGSALTCTWTNAGPVHPNPCQSAPRRCHREPTAPSPASRLNTAKCLDLLGPRRHADTKSDISETARHHSHVDEWIPAWLMWSVNTGGTERSRVTRSRSGALCASSLQLLTIRTVSHCGPGYFLFSPSTY